jgi:predicted Zn-dependent peptidase
MPFDPFAFERRDVAGVPVFVRQLPWVSGHAAIRVALRVGARRDPEGREGLAHFFEHLPFDGCEGAPSHEAIETVRHTLFMGTLNAYTGLEYTVFEGRARKERIGEALDFFRRLIWRPVLAESEIVREKDVITREFWRRFETPKDYELARLRWADSFPAGHRFAGHFNPLGRPETIRVMERESLLAYHRANYVRGNLAIFVAGDIDLPALEAAVAALLADVPAGEGALRPADLPAPIAPPVARRDISYGEFYGVSGDARPKNTTLEWGRVVPRDFAPQRATKLAGHLVSRVLFDEIRGKFGATYAVSPYLSTFADLADVGFYTKTDPDRADEICGLAEATVARLAAADTEFAPKFAEVKGGDLDRALAAEFHSADIADDGATDWAVFGEVQTHAAELEALRAATYESSADLIRRAFLPAECQRFILRP